MTDNILEQRLKLAKQLHQKHRWLYIFAGTGIVFVIGVWFGNRLFSTEAGYWVNLFTESLGVFISVVMFGLVNKWISDRNLRQSLIVQMSSTDNATALNAVSELYERGWTDLSKENLSGANLQSANLSDFNLQECELSVANLRHTVLLNTDLRGTSLKEADLTNAIVELEKSLWTVNRLKITFNISDNKELEKYIIRWNGQTLEEFIEDLNKVQNSTVRMNNETILPDGRRYAPEINLAYFTDNDFPDGKFKPAKGVRNLRLAIHGLLHTPIENEYE